MATQTLYTRTDEATIVTDAYPPFVNLLSTSKNAGSGAVSTVTYHAATATKIYGPGDVSDSITPGGGESDRGFLFEAQAAGAYAAGTWTVYATVLDTEAGSPNQTVQARVWIVTAASGGVTAVSEVTSGAAASSSFARATSDQQLVFTFSTGATTYLTAGQYLYIEFYLASTGLTSGPDQYASLRLNNGTGGATDATNTYLVTTDFTPTAPATKTQTGVSRITKSATQTQTGVARVTITSTRTQTGVSRITATAARTQTGISDILKTGVTRTQTGVARVNVTTTRTQTGLARITATTTMTQSGTGDIFVAGVTRTQTGVATIGLTYTKTQTGKGRITGDTTKTQTGTSAVKKTTTKTQAGKARINLDQARTQTGTSRVTVPTTQDQTGVSRISLATSRTQTGKAKINKTATKTQTGKARVTVTVLRDQPGTARIFSSAIQQTQTGVAHIVADEASSAQRRRDATALAGRVGSPFFELKPRDRPPSFHA